METSVKDTGENSIGKGEKVGLANEEILATVRRQQVSVSKSDLLQIIFLKPLCFNGQFAC